jgi:hypothetical protein
MVDRQIAFYTSDEVDRYRTQSYWAGVISSFIITTIFWLGTFYVVGVYLVD